LKGEKNDTDQGDGEGEPGGGKGKFCCRKGKRNRNRFSSSLRANTLLAGEEVETARWEMQLRNEKRKIRDRKKKRRKGFLRGTLVAHERLQPLGRPQSLCLAAQQGLNIVGIIKSSTCVNTI